MSTFKLLVITCFACICVPRVGYAQVAVRFEPRHKVALENEYVRLLDVRIRPGDTSLFHVHETPSFFIPLSNTAIGSQVQGQLPQESKMTAGATWYNGFEKGPLIHKVWNSDTATLHVIDLELLSAKNSPLTGAAALPGLKIDFENERLRVYKMELLPQDTFLLPRLPTPMIIICVSGPGIQIENGSRKGDLSRISEGGFQWLKPGQHFLLLNEGAGRDEAILILLK